MTVQLRLRSTGAVLRSWSVTARPAGYTPRGRIDLDTGVVDCRRSIDSYFVVRDSSSTRWSGWHSVSSRCAVL